ncbi:reverse transcriptase [Gossypium australe]|uniref:Reverse transcriptase n=1 Tax=Gossypium australe TaxID=47621 RepID=A0A5B6VH75_9ROSI|nr:reverse transcriptase [Gossypium australe]
METKLDQKRMEKVRKSCGLLNGFDVEAEGTRGGLCLAWKEDIDVTLRSFSKWHMDVLIKEDGNQEEWRFTGLYGSPYLKDQNVVWNLLKRLSREGNYPWLVVGDFNEIMYSFEKKGGLPRDNKRMEIFRDTLEDCNLMDIGFSGVWQYYSTSDHCPLLISTDCESRIHRAKDFYFEVWWTMEDTFEETLKEIWESSSGSMVDKLKNLQIRLTKWANKVKGKKGELRKQLSKELENLMKEDRDDDTLSKIIETKIHLNMEIEKDEAYWEQRARVNWLRYGDRNTSFFHNCATTRRRANSIFKLTLDNGKEINEESAIQEEAKLYFENLFTSHGITNPSEILEGIERSISVEVNDRLQAPFTEEEVILALKGMGPTKAPGPDGFPTIFFQKYWHIMGKEVLGYCLGVLNEEREVDTVNTTNIVLIPKIHKPTSLVNFRPISLCTVLYKGKEIFIKFVLQAIPTFAMSCFLLPKVLCEKIESILARFWWQKGPGKRGIHWCQWRFLCRSKEEGGLGFRRMDQFNIALLAKQGWRLLNFPDSLVAKVFKAKYFPDSNFLQSRLGSSCSYIWRSIWATKGILEKGLLWKVGTGENISISQDYWIPNYVNGRLMSRFDNFPCDKVVGIISSTKREWNKELIVNTFPEDVAELILRIPLATVPHEDFLAWSGEPSGVFSVRSSYKLLQSGDPTAYALHNNYRDFYKKIWQVDVPTKVKIFIWKLSWNYIASKVNLHTRRLGNSRLCPRCSGGEESLNHLFRECPVSAEIWRLLSAVDLLGNTNVEFREWLTTVLVSCSLERCRLICIALWSIWGDRNSRIHDKSSRSSQEIVRFIIGYLHELDGIRTNNSKNSNEIKKWKCPPENRLKINFDRAFDGKNKASASGVVVRDSRGNVIISCAIIHRGVQTAFEAEALACRRATQIALDMDRKDSIIEGDSLTVIKKCQSSDQDKSQISPYIFDVHSMKSRDKSLKYEYIPRSANNLAHVLAVETLRRKEEFYLINKIPEFAEIQAWRESVREPD